MKCGADRWIVLRQWSINARGLVLNDVWYSTHNSKQVVVRVGVDVGTKWQFAPVPMPVPVPVPGGLWKSVPVRILSS